MQTFANADHRAAARQLVELIGGNWATQAIGVAARLGLADHVASGVNQLARRHTFAVLASTGLSRKRTYPAATAFSVIEAHALCPDETPASDQ